uniref:Vitellogenin n=1 Tax=Platynereis dumerilii TaxID=6359 RepID=A0A1L5YJB6_PLADU|nr:vitellogenin [Platynereis dumerilii]
MKTLLIFAFSIALAVSALPPNLSKYLPNKEYVYSYESEALTGIPQASNHLAGLKVLAKAHLQLKGANKFLLALRDVQLCQVNEQIKLIRHVTPVESGSACTPIQEPEIARELKENLVKAIRFRWENGQISLLQTDASDAYWSVNLKRGLLNMLHINLQEIEALPTIPYHLREVIKAAVPSAGQRTLGNYYRVMERDLTGKCESIYAIQEEPAQTPVLTVTKVRNFDSCVSRPIFQNGFLAALDVHATSERLPLRSQAYVNYTLTGNRRDFVVKSAFQVGHFIFKPLATVDGQAITFTMQKLVLAEALEAASEIPLGKRREQKDPFLFEMPSSATQLKEVPSSPNAPDAQLIHLAEQKIGEILNLLKSPELALRAPENIAELVVLLRRLPKPSLEKIVAELPAETTNEAALKKKELILDLLPTTGRPDIVSLLEKLIQANKISTTRAAIMVNLMALASEPAPFLIKELLTKYPAFKNKDVQLARSIALTAGSLTNTLQKIYESTAVPQEIANPARHLIVEAFKGAWQSAQATHEKLLIIKALGNAGLVEFVPLLEPIIKDPSANPEVRAKAIYSLRRVSPMAKHLVHSICVPIILTPEAPLEVRIAALLITVHSRPESGVFTMIAQQIARDPSIQFTNFAYTLIKSIAQSELPCNRNISEAASAAIKEVYTNYRAIPLTKLRHFEYIFSHIHQLGADIALELATPNVSALPETLVTRVNAYFAKSLFNVFEFGVESKGILNVLRNLFGPENQWTKVLEGKLSLAEVMSPLIDTSLLDLGKIKNLLINISDRELSGLAAHIYFRVFGSELRFFTLSNNYIKEKIRELEQGEGSMIGALVSGLPINIMKTLSLANQAVMLPTPAGLPVSLSLTTVTIVSAKGRVKLDGISSLSQLLSGNPTVKVNFEVEPLIVTSLYGAMSVELGMVAASTALKNRAVIKTPMKGALSVELASSKVQLTSFVPRQEETIFKVEMIPAAVITKFFPTPKTKFAEITVTPLYNPDMVLPINVELPLGRETLGVELIVKGKYARPMSPLAPLRILCMPHEFEVAIRPASGAPEFIEIIGAFIAPGAPGAEAVKSSVLAGESQPVSHSWFSASSSAAPGITFEAVRPASGISNPITRQLVLSIQTKGQPTPKQVAAQVTVLAAPTFEKIQADIQAGVKYSSAAPVLARIEYIITPPAALIASAPVPTSQEPLAIIRFAYGPQGNTVEYAKIKALYRRLPTSEVDYIKETVIDELKPWFFANIDTKYVAPNQYVVSRASRLSYPSDQGLYAAPSKAQVKPLQIFFEVEYKPGMAIPAYAMPMLNMIYYKALEVPGNLFYPRASVSVEPLTSPAAANMVKAVITTLTTSGTCDMVVRMPTENVYIRGLPLPFPYLFQPFTRFPILPELVKRISGHPSLYHGKCSVSGEQMKTFDHVSYTLPKTSCETILAQDCSSKKLFRVSHMQSPSAPQKKIVKVYIGSEIIEVAPASSWGSHALEVKVNGAPKHIPENSPVSIRGICKVHKVGGMIHITSEKLGIKVETNCNQAHVHVPAWFSSQVCGMCGNFDTEKVGDVRGPNNERYPHPENAIVDYIVPSPSCDAAHVKEKFKASSAGPAGPCTPKPETLYIEHTANNERLACFSARPVMVCPSSCSAARQMSVSMPFACLPADRAATRELINRMRREPLPAVPGAVKTITEQVLTSPACEGPRFYY